MSALHRKPTAGVAEPPSKLLKQWVSLAALTSDRSLGGGPVAVWVQIADHANAQGIAWPGMDLLAQKTGLDRSTVIRSIKKLTAAGYLEVLRRGSFGRSNTYRLTYKGCNTGAGRVDIHGGMDASSGMDAHSGLDANSGTDASKVALLPLGGMGVQTIAAATPPYPTHEPEHEARVHGSDFILPSDAAGTAPAWAGLPSASVKGMGRPRPIEEHPRSQAAPTASRDGVGLAKGAGSATAPEARGEPANASDAADSHAQRPAGSGGGGLSTLAVRGDAVFDKLRDAIDQGELGSLKSSLQAAAEILMVAEAQKIIEPPSAEQRQAAIAKIQGALRVGAEREPEDYAPVFRNEQLVRILEYVVPHLRGNGAMIAQRKAIERASWKPLNFPINRNSSSAHGPRSESGAAGVACD
jgi:Helix-turn-helix domain